MNETAGKPLSQHLAGVAGVFHQTEAAPRFAWLTMAPFGTVAALALLAGVSICLWSPVLAPRPLLLALWRTWWAFSTPSEVRVRPEGIERHTRMLGIISQFDLPIVSLAVSGQ